MYPAGATNQPGKSEGGPTRIYLAGAVRDGAGIQAAPGAVAMRGGRVVAAGAPDAVLAAAGPAAQRVERPADLLIPGLVNAHAHLDMTDIGPRPYEGDFVAWLREVISRREAGATTSESLRHGAELSLAGGVVTVGDITGWWDDGRAYPAWECGLRGVAFTELTGLSGQQLDGNLGIIAHAAEARPLEGRFTWGLQPHAPYSTAPLIYREAAVSGMPISTHLAESRHELELVAEASGPFRRMLEEMGKWNDDCASLYGQDRHPVEWLAEVMDGPILCAHCNYVQDAHIQQMARSGWSVAYCPRASDYFGHHGHRYRDMLNAGVNVCLGTDSIICHSSLSILDEMRHLHRRDGTDPGLLLAMATVNGMRGLGLDARDATFAPGAAPGLVALGYDGGLGGDEPLLAVLRAPEPPSIQLLERP